MAEVGRQETSVFTWNPVEQMWIQERGAATKAPPPPHDVHAIQTWFLDPDESEWIQTVLGPMGRQLAEHWRGAHRVPDAAIIRPKAKPATKRSPLPFLVSAAVLVAVLGGAAVASTRLLAPASTPGPPTSVGPAAVVPGASVSAAPSSDASASASPAATPEPTAEPSAPNATARPRTPVPTAPPTPRPATPAPDFVTPQVGAAGSTFHFTFTGLPATGTYRTSYTRGAVTSGYATGEIPLNGTVQIDLRTAPGTFPPDTYFFTMRAGDVVKTVSFRISG